MEYKITCPNCGYKYRFTATGGQSLIATCPNCGQRMKVNLPTANGQEQTATPQDNGDGNANGYANSVPCNGQDNPKNEKKGKSRQTKIILLALILGIVVGIVGWFAWQQHEKNSAEAQLEEKEARKAHMDSLMALRNQQEAEEQQYEQEQDKKKQVTDFLNNFYTVWFTGGDMSEFSNNLSEQCYEKLQTSLDEESDSTGSDIDWTPICPTLGNAMEGSRASGAVKISVVRYEDNWYRVTFTNDEATESRQIEAFPQNGKVIINDYR